MEEQRQPTLRERAIEEIRRRDFERDKALKDKKPFPWTEQQRRNPGPPFVAPPLPVVITDFMTPEKVQDLLSLPSPPEVEWVPKLSYNPDVPLPGPPESLPVCSLDWYQANQLAKRTEGKYFVVQFNNRPFSALAAYGEGGEDNDGDARKEEGKEDAGGEEGKREHPPKDGKDEAGRRASEADGRHHMIFERSPLLFMNLAKLHSTTLYIHQSHRLYGMESTL
ncbi:hypothetical protein BJX99DRAFT_258667 [Aspergillus californicus]